MSGNAPDPETLAREYRSLRLVRRGESDWSPDVEPVLPHEAVCRGPF